MNQAGRMLNLAYAIHKRGETAIAARVATLAFDASDVEEIFVAEVEDSEEQRAEAVLRKVEATTKGSVFTNAGIQSLLTIAEKLHKTGYPKIAKSINRAAR